MNHRPARSCSARVGGPGLLPLALPGRSPSRTRAVAVRLRREALEIGGRQLARHFFHRRTMAVHPAVNRDPGGSIPPGGARDSCPCRTEVVRWSLKPDARVRFPPGMLHRRAGAAGLSSNRDACLAGFGPPQRHNSFVGPFLRGPERLDYLVMRASAAGSNPATRRTTSSATSPLPASRSDRVITSNVNRPRSRNSFAGFHRRGPPHPARSCACSSADERFPDEEEADGSIPSTRTTCRRSMDGTQRYER